MAKASKSIESKKVIGDYVYFNNDNAKKEVLTDLLREFAFAVEKICLIQDSVIKKSRKQILDILIEDYAASLPSKVSDFVDTHTEKSDLDQGHEDVLFDISGWPS